MCPFAPLLLFITGGLEWVLFIYLRNSFRRKIFWRMVSIIHPQEIYISSLFFISWEKRETRRIQDAVVPGRGGEKRRRLTFHGRWIGQKPLSSSFFHGVGSCYHKNDIIYWAHFMILHSQSRLRKKEKKLWRWLQLVRLLYITCFPWNHRLGSDFDSSHYFTVDLLNKHPILLFNGFHQR